MKVNKFELAPFKLISLGARGDVTVWLKPNRSFAFGLVWFSCIPSFTMSEIGQKVYCGGFESNFSVHLWSKP